MSEEVIDKTGSIVAKVFSEEFDVGHNNFLSVVCKTFPELENDTALQKYLYTEEGKEVRMFLLKMAGATEKGSPNLDVMQVIKSKSPKEMVDFYNENLRELNKTFQDIGKYPDKIINGKPVEEIGLEIICDMETGTFTPYYDAQNVVANDYWPENPTIDELNLKTHNGDPEVMCRLYKDFPETIAKDKAVLKNTAIEKIGGLLEDVSEAEKSKILALIEKNPKEALALSALKESGKDVSIHSADDLLAKMELPEIKELSKDINMFYLNDSFVDVTEKTPVNVKLKDVSFAENKAVNEAEKKGVEKIEEIKSNKNDEIRKFDDRVDARKSTIKEHPRVNPESRPELRPEPKSEPRPEPKSEPKAEIDAIKKGGAEVGAEATEDISKKVTKEVAEGMAEGSLKKTSVLKTVAGTVGNLNDKIDDGIEKFVEGGNKALNSNKVGRALTEAENKVNAKVASGAKKTVGAIKETINKRKVAAARKRILEKTEQKVQTAVKNKVGKKVLQETAKKKAIKKAEEIAVKKVLAKFALKAGGKKIPLLGIAVGTFGAISALMEGDCKAALLEMGSGVSGTFVGIGTAVSVGCDATLIAHEIEKAKKEAEKQVEKEFAEKEKKEKLAQSKAKPSVARGNSRG